LLDNDVDLDGDTLTVIDVGDPLYGTININADGTFTYTTNDGDAHTDVFTYTVSDGEKSDTGIVTIDTNSCRALDVKVYNEVELEAALTCFDTESSGSYRITFGSDITLTERFSSISNQNVELTVDGDGYTLDGANYHTFSVLNSPGFTLTQMTIANGYNSFTSSGGAGVWASDSTVHIVDVTFRDNEVNFLGGAIYADDSILHIENSLFYSNTARYGGGALFLNSDNIVTIVNSTFHNNVSGSGGGQPSAIYATYNTTLGIQNVTLTTDNGSSTYGIYVQRGTTTISNTVIAGFSANCGVNATYGTLVSGGYNLTDDASCFSGGTDTNSTDPLLGALQDNGGPTWTQMPSNSSPLIDGAGSCGVATDQRGELRDDVACDIGAVEVQPPNLELSFITAPTLMLDWSSDRTGCTFDVYSSTSPYIGYTALVTGMTDATYEVIAGTIGDVDINTFFYVTAYGCGSADTAVSNTVGEFDFTISPGS
jgi:predicted outer membrane repeat protein